MTITGEFFPVETTINVRRAEVLTITTTPVVMNMVFTVSTTEGGTPLVQVPTTNGTVTLTPSSVFSLEEGRAYFYNLWNTTTPSDILQLAYGSFKSSDTIEPGSLVAHPTQFIFGTTNLVTLSRSAYNAILVPSPTTLYIII
jgi:hypothetical protein